jgi:hypothetical protein
MTKYFSYCPVHLIYKRFDWIVSDETQALGCVSCFCEARGIPDSDFIPSPVSSPMARASQTAFNKITAKNLRRWKDSGGPRYWVEKHHGSWKYADWLALIENLAASKYWPLNLDQIGATLENQRLRYRKAATQ